MTRINWQIHRFDKTVAIQECRFDCCVFLVSIPSKKTFNALQSSPKKYLPFFKQTFIRKLFFIGRQCEVWHKRLRKSFANWFFFCSDTFWWRKNANRDEKYPIAHLINASHLIGWSCTMEVAFRIRGARAKISIGRMIKTENPPYAHVCSE